MSQGQIHDSDRLARRAGAAEPGPNEFKLTGDAITITDNGATEGDPQSNLRNVRNETTKVIVAESWRNGQRIYWHEAGQVFTTLETDCFVGFAQRNAPDLADTLDQAKKATEKRAWVTAVGHARAKDTIVTIDFALQPELGLIAGGVASDGRYTLRDYSIEPVSTAYFIGLYLTYFGTLTAGATIQLGTDADPDKFLAATLLSAVTAGGDEGERVLYAFPLAAAVLTGNEVVLTITAADAVAGKLKIELVANH